MKHLRLFGRGSFWLYGGLLAVDWLFFSTTDPTKVPSALLIMAFGLLASSLYVVFRGICWVLAWYGWRIKRPRYWSAILTGLITALGALQSIGELSPRDIAVILPITIILYLYVSYGRVPTPKSG